MIIAVVIALVIMMVFEGKISRFINKHPTLQILALSFLILIGFMLLVEGSMWRCLKVIFICGVLLLSGWIESGGIKSEGKRKGVMFLRVGEMAFFLEKGKKS